MEMSVLNALALLTEPYKSTAPVDLPPDVSFLRTKRGVIIPPTGKEVSTYGTLEKRAAGKHTVYGYNGELPDYTGMPAWQKHCDHDATKLVFEFEGKQFYGGTGSAIRGLGTTGTAAMILDCASVVTKSDFSKEFIRSGPKEFEALNAVSVPPPIVHFDWADHSAPWHVKLDFWVKLLGLLPQGRIIACCVGGHGRTGTCLAALMIAATGCSGEQAVQWIRTKHCDKAIEGEAQPKYLTYLGSQATKHATA
jgi:hypothetical protein